MRARLSLLQSILEPRGEAAHGFIDALGSRADIREQVFERRAPLFQGGVHFSLTARQQRRALRKALSVAFQLGRQLVRFPERRRRAAGERHHLG